MFGIAHLGKTPIIYKILKRNAFTLIKKPVYNISVQKLRTYR